jgi:hypothetical protein
VRLDFKGLLAPWDETAQRPLPDDALQTLASGVENEDKAAA